MDKKFIEKLKRQIEYLMKDAKPYTGKTPRLANKPSLFQIIKTKEQADRLMRDHKIASGELIIVEASK